MDTEFTDNVASTSANRSRPRQLPRFSLLSFLLLITLACVGVSHFVVVRERDQLKQTNFQLLNEIGHLAIHDPKKVYVRQLESLDELTWRFRVYLPPTKGFMLNTKASRHSSGGFSIEHDEQFTLTIGIRQHSDGEWKLKSTMPSRSTLGGADAEIAEKFIKAEMGMPVRRGEQKELDPDKPFDLLNYFNGDLHVWISPGQKFPVSPHRKPKLRLID